MARGVSKYWQEPSVVPEITWFETHHGARLCTTLDDYCATHVQLNIHMLRGWRRRSSRLFNRLKYKIQRREEHMGTYSSYP